MFRSQAKPGGSVAGESSDLAASLARASVRLDELKAAADRAVREIEDDLGRRTAVEPGTRIDRERLAAELIGSIAERTRSLRDETGELSRLLGRAREQIKLIETKQAAPEPAAPPPPAPRAPTPPPPAPSPPSPRANSLPRPSEPAAAAESASNNSRAPAQPVSEGLRLLATQMAVAGSSRAEVEERLVREFGVADPGSVLDEVLGPGT